MSKLAWICVMMVVLAANVSAAEWVVVNNSPEPLTARVLQSEGDRTVMQFTVNRYLAGQITIAGKNYTLLDKLRKESTIEEAGMPRLPRINRSLIIPDDGIMSARVLSSDYLEIPNIDLAPSKGHLLRSENPDDTPYAFGAVYTRDAFFPDKLVEMGDPYILRDLRGQVVQINAFQYNPVARVLRVYKNVTVEIRKVEPGGMNVLQRSQPLTKMDSQFAKIYRRHFVNFTDTRYPICYETGGMLVISYDAFMDEMQPWVDWKNQKGMPTLMVPVSQAGTTYTQILNYIQDYYHNNDLCYVLLVGDQAQVPSFTSGSDPVYSLMGGSADWYPDIFVGRFSAQNITEVQTQVERTLTYEKFPNPNSNWYSRGLGQADLDGPCNPEPTDAAHITLIARDLRHWNYAVMDSAYMNWGTTSMIIRKLNNGCSIWNQAGHGTTTMIGAPNFTVSDVGSLVNDNMLPHIVTIACQPGNFQNATCLAEALMRAYNHTTGEPTGTIGCYMSKISQTWFPPYDMQDEGVDLLCAEDMVTLGGYCYNGSGLMIDNFGSQGENEFRAWTLFGDPSLYVRSMRPYPLAVACDSSVQVGTATFNVGVTALGNPQPEAMVCGMNAEIYATGFTDAAGQVTLTFDPAPTQPGTFTLTVTTSNGIPNIREIDILSAGGRGDDRWSSEEPTVQLGPNELPATFKLEQNHPNPFNPATRIGFALPQASQVYLQIYDLAGRATGQPLQGWYEAGAHEVTFEGTGLAAGMYLYQLRAGDLKAMGKMMLVK